MVYDKVYNELKTNEQIVKDILERHPSARDDDFKLYCWVLYNKGINIDQTLRQFCGTALEKNMPAFASITKCRRTLQGVYPHLQGTNKEGREQAKMAHVQYNRDNQ